MAEIKVEKKNKTPIWPWIIGILVLLGLIWLLIDAFSEDQEEFDLEEIDPEEVEGNLGTEPLHHPHTILLADFERA